MIYQIDLIIAIYNGLVGWVWGTQGIFNPTQHERHRRKGWVVLNIPRAPQDSGPTKQVYIAILTLYNNRM